MPETKKEKLYIFENISKYIIPFYPFFAFFEAPNIIGKLLYLPGQITVYYFRISHFIFPSAAKLLHIHTSLTVMFWTGFKILLFSAVSAIAPPARAYVFMPPCRRRWPAASPAGEKHSCSKCHRKTSEDLIRDILRLSRLHAGSLLVILLRLYFMVQIFCQFWTICEPLFMLRYASTIS